LVSNGPDEVERVEERSKHRVLTVLIETFKFIRCVQADARRWGGVRPPIDDAGPVGSGRSWCLRNPVGTRVDDSCRRYHVAASRNGRSGRARAYAYAHAHS
jgi:hypothetical protein